MCGERGGGVSVCVCEGVCVCVWGGGECGICTLYVVCGGVCGRRRWVYGVKVDVCVCVCMGGTSVLG